MILYLKIFQKNLLKNNQKLELINVNNQKFRFKNKLEEKAYSFIINPNGSKLNEIPDVNLENKTPEQLKEMGFETIALKQ